VFGNDADLVMTEINSMMGLDSPVEVEVLVRNLYDPQQFPRRPFWIFTSGANHPPLHLLLLLPTAPPPPCIHHTALATLLPWCVVCCPGEKAVAPP
jgi:hypothetical protein